MPDSEYAEPVLEVPVAPSGPDAVVVRHPFLVMLVASCGFVIVLDSFAAAVAFPRIVQAFPDTPRTTLAWLSTGYAIALSALLLVAGKLADRYGMRRVFLIGMGGFMVGAIASALAPNVGLLIAARVAQGSAGALMVSTSIALALLGYPAERRGTAMGAIGILGSVASLAGPVLAGSIIDIGGSWRWVFLVSVPIGAVVLAVGPRVLPVGTPTTSGERVVIDLIGVVQVVLASGLLTLGMLQSGAWGWGDWRTATALVVAVVTGTAFVRRCRRVSAPLLSFDLFRRPTFLVATVSQNFSQMAVYGFFFWAPLFLTNVWGWSASRVGWVTAIPLLLACSSLPFGRFADRHGYRGLLVLGGIVCSSSLLCNILVLGESPSFWRLLPGLVLFGVGIGMIGITTHSGALAGVDRADLAEANSVFQTCRRQVQTLGIAVVLGLLGARSADSLDRFRLVWIVAGVLCALSSVIAAWYPRPVSRST